MKKRLLLLALTLALLVTCAVFSVSAAGETTGNTFETNFVCPCGCGDSFDEIEWRVWGDSTKTPSGTYDWNKAVHYLVESTLGPGSAGTLAGAGETGAKKIVVVFHKADSSDIYFGSTLESNTGVARTNRTFVVPAGTTAWLVGDHATVWGPAAAGDVGGIIKVESGATLTAIDMKFRTRTNATNVPTQGGIFYNEGTLTLKNCTVTGITVTGNGGAIWSSGNVTLSGSTTVKNGNATQGGNIYMIGKGSAAATLTIQDTASVTGGVAARNGGNVALEYSAKAANLTMTGGTISGGTANGDGTVSNADYYNEGYLSYLVDYVYGGGNIFVFRACVANISGGTVSNGTAAACGGGNVFVQGTLNVSGTAKLTGGTAIKGGNIYAFDRNPCTDSDKDGVADKNPNLYAYVNISGGEVTGGAAVGTADTIAMGGTIYAYGGGKNQTNSTGLKITGGTIGGGTANGDKGGIGAAIYVNNTVANVSNCTINGGTATRANGNGGLGGAIYQGSGSFTMGENTVVSGGTAWRGGCVYLNAGTFNMNGGTISGGVSTNQGAQVFMGGTFNMTAGTVTGNSKSTSNAPCFRIQDGILNLSGDAVVVAGGTGLDDALDVVSVSGVGQVTLAGNATVKNSSGKTNENNIINMQNYNGKTAKLTVKEGWNGTARVNFEYLFGTSNKEADYAVGMVLDTAAAASTGDYAGTLYMYGAPTQPPLYANNGNLQVATVQLCTYNLPKLDAVWFKTATEAAAAAKPGDYISIYVPGTMDIGSKDILADFNGNDCTVTGTGKLYIMDAAGDAFDGTLAKITYDNVATSALNPYNDNQYITLSNGDGTYSAHRIDLRISAVSVRPRSAGVYYTAELNCDDVLRAAFQKAGVAVSLDAIPGYDFAAKSLYTEIEALTEAEFTGVLINEILKDGENNDYRGNLTIYANAYATFTVDGQTVTVLADPYNTEKTKGNFLPGHNYTAYSLNDVMQALDLRWRALDDASRERVLELMYNAYDGVMQDWNLRYINAYVTGESVKDLKVLTIGNSLSVDAGHMLGYIAKIEGMENIHFSTLYYGGCTLRQHATFLTNNTPEYRWYDTNITDLQNTAVADTVPEVSMKKADQVTMYQGIVADDWDIIIMQQGVFESGKASTHTTDMQTVIDYVRKHATNPNVVLMWNMIWAPPVEAEMMDKSNNGIAPDAPGFESSYKTTTGFDVVKDNKEAQNKMFDLIRNAVQTKVVTNGNFIDVIPAGTAQQNALWSGLSDADLYRDYIHASDLARYIYSYMWYCKLTDSDFDGVASDTVPLAVRYIKADDISEIPAATTDLDLTANDNYLLNIVNFAITSALADPYTPHAMTE